MDDVVGGASAEVGGRQEPTRHFRHFAGHAAPVRVASGIAPAAHKQLHVALRMLVASVWVFHGFYSKLLNGIPRHRLIVERVLGEELGGVATLAIGALEILLGLWVLSGIRPRTCAAVQTLAIVAMNTIEIVRAEDLLISAPGMVALNAAFLALAWHVAISGPKAASPRQDA